MQSRLINDQSPRIFALILESGDEVMDCVKQFADSEHLSAAGITGIGAFSDAELLYFDWNQKTYVKNRVDEQVEVAALAGDVALGLDGEPAIHIHLVLGRRDGTALAGHLGSAHVRPTLELIVTETPAHLQKVKDAETGLALIRPDAEIVHREMKP